MAFSAIDKKYMKLALKQASIALKHMDHPVGAVLTVNGKLVGIIRHTSHSKKDMASHAEADLLRKYSARIREEVKVKKSNVTLYATLEPCLMCLGTAVLHQITRIVYACPDPHGGATNINPKKLTPWYVRKWPIIEGGLYKEQSCKIVSQFLKNKNTPTELKMLELYKKMSTKWK